MSKKILIPGIIIGFLCLFFMISCDKKVAKLAVPVSTSGLCDTITYNKQIKKLIDQNCGSLANNGIGCHSGSSPSGGVSLTDYAQVKDRADAGRIKIRVFDLGTMPQSPEVMTQDEKDLLKCWLENGTKE
jgi:uncharacterized membrane protein